MAGWDVGLAHLLEPNAPVPLQDRRQPLLCEELSEVSSLHRRSPGTAGGTGTTATTSMPYAQVKWLPAGARLGTGATCESPGAGGGLPPALARLPSSGDLLPAGFPPLLELLHLRLGFRGEGCLHG
jgi:hypothetical protein